jgi:hypothetical protein
MSTVSKQIPYLPFFNEKKILEESVKSFDEESLKKQVRLQFHKIHALEKMVLKHQEYILKLTDFILEE